VDFDYEIACTKNLGKKKNLKKVLPLPEPGPVMAPTTDCDPPTPRPYTPGAPTEPVDCPTPEALPPFKPFVKK